MSDGAAQPATHEEPGLSEQELEHLVDKVYRLLLDDIRLGRARGEPLPSDGRRVRTGAW